MEERCKLPHRAEPEKLSHFSLQTPLKISVFAAQCTFCKKTLHIHIRAKDNEVYCDNAPRYGRQQAAENIGYARVSKPYFSILSLGCM